MSNSQNFSHCEQDIIDGNGRRCSCGGHGGEHHGSGSPGPMESRAISPDTDMATYDRLTTGVCLKKTKPQK